MPDLSQLVRALDHTEMYVVERLEQYVVMCEDGGVYSGSLKHGLKHGHGVLRWASGASYKGDFQNGEVTGRGMFTFADASRYEGEFKDGMFCGEGELFHSDGRVLFGVFRNGCLDGHGCESFPNGDCYVGEWKDGDYHGFGAFVTEELVSEGWWSLSRLHGEGAEYWTDGSWFKGQFEYGERHGRGVMWDSRTQTWFHGTFRDGMKLGLGMISFSQRAGTLKATWKRNKLVNGRGVFYPFSNKVGLCYEVQVSTAGHFTRIGPFMLSTSCALLVILLIVFLLAPLMMQLHFGWPQLADFLLR
eukprot:TRINITY_DN42478_c0_g2_i1.p1 TRINITY_DN42478_c0_g2~~TRINITY_DN42478_c0_g2_i1.p1  ORF type:complete len:302 (-),score=28.64 TRINITY_DN42478_c0_g2_i1:293-1198(-)